VWDTPCPRKSETNITLSEMTAIPRATTVTVMIDCRDPQVDTADIIMMDRRDLSAAADRDARRPVGLAIDLADPLVSSETRVETAAATMR